ncbi:MAG TPA: hypothetical protein VJA26_07260 [Gammaproteobacteria bacterium]|nr:hypothetical protein [Gammaproteobacteria bacterium]
MNFFAMLESTWPAQLIANSIWGFPILEIVHLCGLTVVFGGMILIDFRLLGVRADLSVLKLEHYVLPFVWWGFVIAAFSGGWLFLFEATTLVRDPPFLLKMLLIPLAGLNALFMHKVAMRDVASWDTALAAPVPARLSAALSIVIWTTVLACGRLIAYFYPPPI